jgi:hypothetical protein
MLWKKGDNRIMVRENGRIILLSFNKFGCNKRELQVYSKMVTFADVVVTTVLLIGTIS